MFFRSVNALPSCLQARLVRRCTSTLKGGQQQSRQSSIAAIQSTTLPRLQVEDVDAQASPQSRPLRTNDQQYATTAQVSKTPSLAVTREERTINHDFQPFHLADATSSATERYETPASCDELNDVFKDWITEVKKNTDSGPGITTKNEAGTHLEPGVQFRFKWENLYSKLMRIHQENPGTEKEHFSAEHELAKDLTTKFDADIFRHDWRLVGESEQTQVGPRLLIGSLVDSAAMTLFVLGNVGYFPSQFQIRMHCLRHIALVYREELRTIPSVRQKYEEELEKLRSPSVWSRDRMRVGHLDHLLRWSTPEQCEAIVQDFRWMYPHASSDSLLPIIAHYTRIGNTEEALRLFQQLPDTMKQGEAYAKYVRNWLLKRDTVVKSESGSNFKILPQILGMGVTPDASLHNAVIQSAVSNNMSHVAWDLYRYMAEQSLEVDSTSYLFLLQDAFRREQVGAVNEIMTAIYRRDDLVKDPSLLMYCMNIVRVVCYHEKKASSHESMSHIMALYDRAWNRAPLVKLGIVHERPAAADGQILPSPCPRSLAAAVWSYVLVQQIEARVTVLWQWFVHLIEAGDKSIVDAARLDQIYNGFILFYSRSERTLLKALQIVYYMLDKNLCEPTPRTWSLLVCSFLKHGQQRQATAILEAMRARGIDLGEINEAYMPKDRALQELIDSASLTLLEGETHGDVGLAGDRQALAMLLEKSASSARQRKKGRLETGFDKWQWFVDLKKTTTPAATPKRTGSNDAV